MSATETPPPPQCPSCGATSVGPLVDCDAFVCYLCPASACDRIFVIVLTPGDDQLATYGLSELLT